MKFIVILLILAVGLAATLGLLRIYHGSTIGTRIVAKGGFSFKDTIVNVDRILTLPRTELALKHPAIERQLEEMGVLTPEEGGSSASKLDAKTRRSMRKWKSGAKQAQEWTNEANETSKAVSKAASEAAKR